MTPTLSTSNLEAVASEVASPDTIANLLLTEEVSIELGLILRGLDSAAETGLWYHRLATQVSFCKST